MAYFGFNIQLGQAHKGQVKLVNQRVKENYRAAIQQAWNAYLGRSLSPLKYQV